MASHQIRIELAIQIRDPSGERLLTAITSKAMVLRLAHEDDP
jgi:hypothetical protein